jgi:hypothetical protein
MLKQIVTASLLVMAVGMAMSTPLYVISDIRKIKKDLLSAKPYLERAVWIDTVRILSCYMIIVIHISSGMYKQYYRFIRPLVSAVRDPFRSSLLLNDFRYACAPKGRLDVENYLYKANPTAAPTSGCMVTHGIIVGISSK